MKPCNRCGICCSLGLCAKGRRKNKKIKGNCLYLIRHEDNTTSCKLVIDGKMKWNFINLYQGCIMQEKYSCQYEFYTEMRKYELKNNGENI